MQVSAARPPAHAALSTLNAGAGRAPNVFTDVDDAARRSITTSSTVDCTSASVKSVYAIWRSQSIVIKPSGDARKIRTICGGPYGASAVANRDSPPPSAAVPDRMDTPSEQPKHVLTYLYGLRTATL
jgi:hypothetical protein